MPGPNTTILPILPLARDSVLFPGITLRVPIYKRPDIPALLTSLYTRAATPKLDAANITIGCVPFNSPLLSSDGQNLLGEHEHTTSVRPEVFDVDPAKADQQNLFHYGTVAKVSGVQGRQRELALVVEGYRRFRVERWTQFKPYLCAEVTYLDDDEVNADDAVMHNLFDQLQQRSKELFSLIRIASLLPRSPTSISPLLARRFEMYVAKKELSDAGILADFMTNVFEATFEEKLRILAALDVKVRLERVVELLAKQVESLKGNVKITAVTTTKPSRVININDIPADQRDAFVRQAMRGLGLGQAPPGALGRGGSDDGGANEDEPNEIDELKKKLDDANLTSEAQKVADRELKRLKKMNPAQAEYGVCRTYLETLAEIPWSTATDDRLGVDTLKRARKQLDDDHYGLEKIKKRLLEYLAVLRLKQVVNAGLDAQAAEEQKATESLEIAKDQELSMRKPGQFKQSNTPRPGSQLLQTRRMVDKSPILLLVGPPGTGKTSLAKSVATALGRKFHRISLGGVRDEAEIRGHRRTYVAAMPGLIVSGLRKVGVCNPVILLDEIDKVGGSNFHGDPSAAMLEVLDPEQNHTFMDHYVNIPIDLSKVLFIATANSLDTIPPPLLDRMETIGLSGYTSLEKRHIALQHLIPKQITSNGLQPPLITLPPDVLDTIITSYTREAGVRNLEREIGSVCRYKAVQYSDARDHTISDNPSVPQITNLSCSPEIPQGYNPLITESDLESILGVPRFEEELAAQSSIPGIVTGLVAYSTGGQGSILFIEVADMPGSGRVQLTGKLGDVLKESVEVALTWVKAHAFALGLTPDPREDIMKNRSVHVHCPSGAVPKDGPSAGLAHTVALVSLFAGKCVPSHMAMTGEVSLRGRVLPVGGIKEKLIGALRAGVKTVLLPQGNRKDVKDLPEEVQQGLEIVYVSGIWEALRAVWPGRSWRGEVEGMGALESRL
ncbi:hypothetical protein MMC25_005669 [Agyrium rufum]|nr:hypothetical protein [Agyrium rufum]